MISYGEDLEKNIMLDWTKLAEKKLILFSSDK